MKKCHLKSLFFCLSAMSVGVAFVSVPSAQGETETQYREFTGANGKVIEAALIDKSDTEVVLLLSNGSRATLTYDKLSVEDQDYVRGWSKGKAMFLQHCRGLEIRELLELRGYESFKYEMSGNGIVVQGYLNNTPARFLVDTGAAKTVLHLPSAKEAQCQVGEMDQKIRGIAGETAAGWTQVSELKIGEAILKDQSLLSANLAAIRRPGSFTEQNAILGADILARLHAVIFYKEGLLFLRPDLADGEGSDNETPEFRLFKTSDGKAFRGKVLTKTDSAVNLKLESGKEIQWSISRLSPEDETYVRNWTFGVATFLTRCHGLTVEELLKLREYESFQYERRDNYIFVDGKLSALDTIFLFDTEADTSLLHSGAAGRASLTVGPMDVELRGVGGIVMAGETKVPTMIMGDVTLENYLILTTNLFPKENQKEFFGAAFGADFMRGLNGVVTYRENQIFLRQE